MSEAALGLLLAALAAAATNGAYVVQHGALAAAEPLGRRASGTLRLLLSSRRWVAGALLGYVGLAAQIAAMTLIPLWNVQAVMAGGLLLALGGWTRCRRTGSTPRLAVAMILLGGGLVAVLAGGAHGASPSSVPVAGLALFLVAVIAAGVALPRHSVRLPRPTREALLAGLYYGATTTALAGALTALAGDRAVAAGMLVVAALLAIAGLLRFQRALQAGEAVTVVLLMSAATNATAMLGGILLAAGSAPGLLTSVGLTALCGAGVAAALPSRSSRDPTAAAVTPPCVGAVLLRRP